ncbi:MAG: hypothetical protein Q4F60_02295 [Candidatus Saccharibacteria bacterium]|nr:hypothetical protein [Candidatus Saccharibacteria bacterium]
MARATCPFSGEVCRRDCALLIESPVETCALLDGAVALGKIAQNTDRIIETLEGILVRMN